MVQADSVHMDLKSLKDAVLSEGDEEGQLAGEFDPRKHIEAHLPVQVNEQIGRASCRERVVAVV